MYWDAWLAGWLAGWSCLAGRPGPGPHSNTLGFGSPKAKKAKKAKIINQIHCVLQHISAYILAFSGFWGFGKARKAKKAKIICQIHCVLQHISDYILAFSGFSGFGLPNLDVLE